MLPETITSQIDAEGPCWLWLGAKLPKGYGLARWHGKTTVAHRVVWEILVGPIPPGMVIDHLCLVKSCVNPDHLEVVTPAENSRRSWWATSTVCAKGLHVLADNPITFVDRKGRAHRTCRQCWNTGLRRRRALATAALLPEPVERSA